MTSFTLSFSCYKLKFMMFQMLNIYHFSLRIFRIPFLKIRKEAKTYTGSVFKAINSFMFSKLKTDREIEVLTKKQVHQFSNSFLFFSFKIPGIRIFNENLRIVFWHVRAFRMYFLMEERFWAYSKLFFTYIYLYIYIYNDSPSIFNDVHFNEECYFNSITVRVIFLLLLFILS